MALILASGSPRRRELLGLITHDFTVRVSEVDESRITAPSPAALVQRLAEAKCRAVAGQCPGDTVLGCDTVVDCDGVVFGKPKNAAHARQMLQALSGRAHLVHTGVCVYRAGRYLSAVETTTVHFAAIDPGDLEAYLTTDEPYDKAGAYAIQGHAALWCTGIAGCYYTIMGLPVYRTAQLLQQIAR